MTAVYAVVTTEGGGNVTMEYVADYKKGITYTVTNGLCKTSKGLTILKRSCVPPDAVYLGSMKIGSAINYITTSNYRYTIRRPQTSAVYMESMKFRSGMNCYDIASSQVVESSKGVVLSATDIVFGNFETFISDPSVFNVPSECTRRNPSAMESVFDETVHDFIKHII
jgi:hypothetical protein